MESGKWISEVANGYGTTLEITEHLFSKKARFSRLIFTRPASWVNC